MVPRLFVAGCLSLVGTTAVGQRCPELVGRWPAGPSFAVAVDGWHVSIGSGETLLAVDVSTSSSPQLAGLVTLPEVVRGVAVAGDHAHVANGWHGLRVIDLSTPTAIFEVGHVVPPVTLNETLAVAVQGNHAYLANDEAGLRVIDVSTPSNPVEVGSLDTPGLAFDLAVAGNHAFVADHDGGLRVIDVSDPSNPAEVAALDTPGDARAVTIAAGHAYLADHYGGLRVIDVSTPSNPVVVDAGYAYVADRAAGIRVVDVSAPASPVEVGFYDTPGERRGVALIGGELYVADYEHGLALFELGGCPLFFDGFETGDASGWNGVAR